jgi:dTMP kinase
MRSRASRATWRAAVDPYWVRNLYSFAYQPDLVLYFRVPLDDAVERITFGRAKLKYYEAGMDLNLSDNKVTSFRLFQTRILDEYEKMVDEFNFQVIDATLPVQIQQKQIRRLVSRILRDWEGLPNPIQSARNYSREQAKKAEEASHD